MLSVAESSTKQPATSVNRGSAVEPMPTPPRENWFGRTSTIDPLAMAIVHDLRNPLATICVCAEMFTGPHLTPDHAVRLGRNIRLAAGRMQELLADLVSVTQGKIAGAENCNLREILAAACEHAAVAADNQSVEILLDLPTRMEITVARIRMERVFINLITNALEAMPGGRENPHCRKERRK